MKAFFKLLVIGWSIACVGIFVIFYKEMKLGAQATKAELCMLKPSGGGWEDVLKIESLTEPPGVIPKWFKEIATQNPKSLEYRETNSLEGKFYFQLSMFCFAVWACPILVFSSVGLLFGKKTIILEDTEHSTGQIALYKPFATKILTPACYMTDLGSKQVRYEGCHEMAYLHPKYFTPDPTLLDKWGVSKTEKFAVVRFVSWKASHDIGQYGFANEQKLNFIKELAKYARPYITSEGTLPPEFEPYRLKIPVHQIHHLMAFAALYVGEGATMASESAILGVPAVYINTLKLGYVNMHEGYGLLKQTTDTQQALRYCIEWLTDPAAKEKCRAARERLLADKIDVTDYLVNTIEQAGRSGQVRSQ